jgi:hypothetical protein
VIVGAAFFVFGRRRGERYADGRATDDAVVAFTRAPSTRTWPVRSSFSNGRGSAGSGAQPAVEAQAVFVGPILRWVTAVMG